MGLPNEVSSALIGAANQGGYQIQQSLRFRQTQKLVRTNGTNNATGDHTFSVWFKVGSRTQGQHTIVYNNSVGGDNGQSTTISIGAGGIDDPYINVRNASTSASYAANTDQLIRDYSGWYHLVHAVDYGSYAKTWINGVESAPSTTANSTHWGLSGSGQQFQLGGLNHTSSAWWDGYMAEVHFVDGSALSPTDFGEYNDDGVWIPKQVSGVTYGDNGFYLKFDPSATNGIGHDHSGNGNNLTASGFTTSGTGTDVMDDTPTKNWCTLNPLIISNTTTEPNLSKANLFGSFSSNDAYPECGATFSPMGLKGYFELSDADSSGGGGSGQDFLVGFIKTSEVPKKTNYTNSNAFYYDLDNGRIRQGSTTLISSYTSQSVADDIIGVAFDFTGSNRNVWFSLNGTWGNNGSGVGNPATGANPGLTASDLGTTDEYRFYFGFGLGPQVTFNFGQREFEQTVPTGYSAMNTSNLPAPDIADGSQYFNTITYTGDGQSSKAITGVGFQPNFSVIKNRSNSNHHIWQDSVRGITANNGNQWVSSNNFVENGNGNGHVGSYDSDGFTVEDGTSVNYPRQSTNYNNHNYVAWLWKAGTASGSSNTSGSITSTVSANATAGFSIVTYTGSGSNATVGHGLGVAPKMVIIKSRSNAVEWIVYHSGVGATKFLNLNGTGSASTNSSVFNNTAPTSSTFAVGTVDAVNYSSYTYGAYCFAEVEGYSKFGSYTGNGGNNGPFVYCGFRPMMVLIRAVDNAGKWIVNDVARSTYNVTNHAVYFEDTRAEESNGYASIDILSNGFKIRSNWSDFNTNGNTFIFAAFASSPFGGDGVSPATAR